MKNIIFISENLNKEFYKYIEKYDYEIVKIKKSTNTYESISSHPDIFVFSTDKKIIVDESIYKNLKNKFGDIIIKGDSIVSNKYPNNIFYNVAKVGEFAIHNVKYTDKKIIDYSNFKWINVNQGYSKCNTLVVDDNSIITSDIGIYKEVIKVGINALLIRPGHVILKGLDYGFIGGTAVRINNEIIFYGNIEQHPDYNKISEFIKSRNLNIKSFQFELEDIGSCIKFKRN